MLWEKRELCIRRNKQENKKRNQREIKSQLAGQIEMNLMKKLFVNTVEYVSHLENIWGTMRIFHGFNVIVAIYGLMLNA